MKHLIIGLDGTNNAAYNDMFTTNVYKLGLSLRYINEQNEHQLFYYYPGVGTPTRRTWAGVIDAITGDSVDFFAQQAYINLVLNYEKGDKVYIFGYSRGAVVARALAGLIATSGIVSVDDPSLIKLAWDYYVDQETYGDFETKRDDKDAESVHFPAPIEFIGVWDTVPGPVKRKETIARFRFRDKRLQGNVKKGAHLVSIDETRKSFKPILWENNDAKDVKKISQVWMPGVHSDIGGGTKNGSLSDASLLTMIDIFKAQCPDISWESTWITNQFQRNDDVIGREIIVNDDWARWFSNFYLNQHYRRPWGQDLVHPLVREMIDKEFNIKGREKRYRPMFRGDASSMNVLKLASNSFSKACKWL